MRNFILFIRKFFNLILFLGLEVLCLVLIARTKDLMQGNDVLSSANAVTGYFYNRQNQVVEYFGLSRMNDSLLLENARLRSQLLEYVSVDTFQDKDLVQSVPNNDSAHTVRYAKYHVYEAKIISNSVDAPDNYITINRGAKDGIGKGMAVISGSGIVGQVMNVSDHFATVLSVLNSKRTVSAVLADGTPGNVMWEKNATPDILMMKDVLMETKIHFGDSVFTAPYSTLFPGGHFLIGTVVKYKKILKDNSLTLYIRPSTNYRIAQYVYVIGDDYMDERRALEANPGKSQSR